MKVIDVVKDTDAWKDLAELLLDMMHAGKQAKDGGLYMLGVKLAGISARLGDVEIPGGKHDD